MIDQVLYRAAQCRDLHVLAQIDLLWHYNLIVKYALLNPLLN